MSIAPTRKGDGICRGFFWLIAVSSLFWEWRMITAKAEERKNVKKAVHTLSVLQLSLLFVPFRCAILIVNCRHSHLLLAHSLFTPPPLYSHCIPFSFFLYILSSHLDTPSRYNFLIATATTLLLHIPLRPFCPCLQVCWREPSVNNTSADTDTCLAPTHPPHFKTFSPWWKMNHWPSKKSTWDYANGSTECPR